MALQCVAFLSTVFTVDSLRARSGRIPEEFRAFAELRPSLPQRLIVWSAHTWMSAAVAVCIGIFLGRYAAAGALFAAALVCEVAMPLAMGLWTGVKRFVA